MRVLIAIIACAILAGALPSQGQQRIPGCGLGSCLADLLIETGDLRYGERVAKKVIKYSDTTHTITVPPGACVKAAYFMVGSTGFDGGWGVNIGDGAGAGIFLAAAGIATTAGAFSGAPNAATPGPTPKCYAAGGSILIAPTTPTPGAGTAHSGSGTAYVIYDELPRLGTPKSTSTPTRTPTSTPTPTKTPTPTPT